MTGFNFRSLFRASASLTALVCATSGAWAQAPLTEPQNNNEKISERAEISEVVVTGTRVRAEGFDQPTPTMVIGKDMLEMRAPPILVDVLALLPIFRNSSTATSANQAVAAGGGQSFVNMRGLGANRTLVLLNGQRYVPTTALGTVDIAVLPSALVKRAEVVTGGASAAYGSDAVAGVVNFILDTEMEGVEANLEGGISTRGDNGTQKASLSWGGRITDRLHFIASGEYYRTDGVAPRSRDFTKLDTFFVNNPDYTPTNGQAPLLLRPYVYNFGGSPNGVVISGPFRGTEFLPGGGTRQYDLCTTGSTAFVACPGLRTDATSFFDYTYLASPQERGSAYGRLTFEATPGVDVFFDAQYGDSTTHFYSIPYATNFFGALTIRRDNAFLPAAFAAQMDQDGQTAFQLGRFFADHGPARISRSTEVYRFSAGVDADLGNDWKLNTYSSYGLSYFHNVVANQPVRSRFNNSVDSVLVNGVPTCRINANAISDPACVPVNVFGDGSPSEEAKKYYTSDAILDLTSKQVALGVNVSGEPIATWAGPVPVAFGAEYRRESVDQTVDVISKAVGFVLNNPGSDFSGNLNVKEIYGEVVVPLAKELPLLEVLEVNGAVRYTDYSISGGVTTWKLGGNYSPIEGLRFRGTRSRDIRAPNLFELFSSGAQTAQVVSDPKRGGAVAIFPGFVGIGNQSLTPEIAMTTSFGVVTQPHFLPGFSASVDYYRIKIKDAIASLTAPDIVNRCAGGNMDLCRLITRTDGDGSGSGQLMRIDIPAFNLQTIDTAGIDFEVSYHFPAGYGVVVLRALANYIDRFKIDDSRTTVEQAGDLGRGLAKWNFDLSTSYSLPDMNFLLMATRIGSGIYSATNVVDVPKISGVWYFDATVTKDVEIRGQKFTLYANIDNIFDKKPPFSFENQLGNYDRIGTMLRLGTRFRF